MEKARGEPRSRKKVDIERSGDRIDSRISIYNSLRGVIFCHGNGEVENESHQETYKKNQRNEL